MTEMDEQKRKELLEFLAQTENRVGDEYQTHLDAEDKLLELINDPEIKTAWLGARGFWWYA